MALDRDRWGRDGYLVIDDFVAPGELERLRTAYDQILEREVVALGDRMLGGVTRQVMLPAKAHEAFAHTETQKRALALARALFDTPDVFPIFDMLIDKPPGHPHDTPWHQDAAYGKRPFTPPGQRMSLESMQFWVALDDADPENGCMHFVPGLHTRPLLPHQVASGDPEDEARLLGITDPDAHLPQEHRVACPVRAGGCTVHSYGTPHYTPPNRSASRRRRAWIFNVSTARGVRTMLGKDDASPAGEPG